MWDLYVRAGEHNNFFFGSGSLFFKQLLLLFFSIGSVANLTFFLLFFLSNILHLHLPAPLPSSCIRLICKRISLALQPVLYCPVSGSGGFIKYIGEEYQIAKRRRKFHGCGEEYNLEKREKGRNIIFPIVFRLLGRISSGEEGKETEMFGKKIKILWNERGTGEAYFIYPYSGHCLYSLGPD